MMVHLDVAASCCCPVNAPAAGAPATEEGPASPGVGGAYENCEVSRPYLRVAKDYRLRTCCPAQSNGSLPLKRSLRSCPECTVDHWTSCVFACICMRVTHLSRMRWLQGSSFGSVDAAAVPVSTSLQKRRQRWAGQQENKHTVSIEDKCTTCLSA